MSFSPSQFDTSGSESGWTMYLDQSQSYSYYPYVNECHGRPKEAEDLSMVSDASSGPPHFHEEDEGEEGGEDDCINGGNGCSSASKSKKKGEKKKKMGEHMGKLKKHSCLDDTASSPVKGLSKKKTSASHGQDSMQHVSATHSKGSASFQRRFNFLRSSVSEKPASNRQG